MDKPFKTLEEQIDILESRGLKVQDRAKAISILEQVNYYRFSAYSLTFRKNDRFYADATFDDIMKVYSFDASMRSIVMKYTSVVETTIRARVAYTHAKNHGPLAYREGENFRSIGEHKKFIEQINKEINRSSDVFVQHYKEKYDGRYPIWVVVEISSFDVMSRCYKNLLATDQKEIADAYGQRRFFVESWLHCSVIARNIAAHGGRFYNRPLRVKPKLPDRIKGKIKENRAFAYFYGIYNLLDEDYQAELIEDLEKLFETFSVARKEYLGFPENWVDILKTKPTEEK